MDTLAGKEAQENMKNHIKFLKDLTTWEFRAKALINDINEKI